MTSNQAPSFVQLFVLTTWTPSFSFAIAIIDLFCPFVLSPRFERQYKPTYTFTGLVELLKTECVVEGYKKL